MGERGIIRNRQFKQQISDFSGLSYPGGITPTDMDMFVEFKGKLFVFAEAKFGGARLSRGQEMAIERLCDLCHNQPKTFSVAFVVSHNSDDDVDYANTLVTRYRWFGKWVTPRAENPTLRHGIDRMLRITGLDNVTPLRRVA